MCRPIGSWRLRLFPSLRTWNEDYIIFYILSGFIYLLPTRLKRDKDPWVVYNRPIGSLEFLPVYRWDVFNLPRHYLSLPKIRPSLTTVKTKEVNDEPLINKETKTSRDPPDDTNITNETETKAVPWGIYSTLSLLFSSSFTFDQLFLKECKML